MLRLLRVNPAYVPLTATRDSPRLNPRDYGGGVLDQIEELVLTTE